MRSTPRRTTARDAEPTVTRRPASTPAPSFAARSTTTSTSRRTSSPGASPTSSSPGAASRPVRRGSASSPTTGSTVERAQVVAAAVPGVVVLGAITLNRSVGGLNPLAVEVAARQGARIVWFPTVSAVNEQHEVLRRGQAREGARLGRVRALAPRGRPRRASPCRSLDDRGDRCCPRRTRCSTSSRATVSSSAPVISAATRSSGSSRPRRSGASATSS